MIVQRGGIRRSPNAALFSMLTIGDNVDKSNGIPFKNTVYREFGKVPREGYVEMYLKDGTQLLNQGMVHQHFKLVEVFTVLDNIILGVEQTKNGFLQKREARRKVMSSFAIIPGNFLVMWSISITYSLMPDG